MKQALFAALCAVLLSAIASAEVKQQPVNTIFQQALAADIAGNEPLRDSLLADVLARDPENKLAHWQSGQVLHNGQWSSLQKVEEKIASDPNWQEYRERIEAGEDTLVSHAELARWCQTQGLELEARWHWFNVLRHDNKNSEALGALDVRPYRGEYLTAEEIEKYKADDEAADKNYKQYAKLLKLAIRDAERTEGSERAIAINRIAQIDDPGAVNALMDVVLADVKNERRILNKFGKDKGAQFLRQLQLAAITALSSIPEHNATICLLEASLYGSDAEIRASAAHALKYRRQTDFVPQLMANLAAPIELGVSVNRLPNGSITVLEDYYEAGPLANHKHTRATTFLTEYAVGNTRDRIRFSNVPGIVGGAPRSGAIWSDRLRDETNASAQIADAKDQVAAINAAREETNARVQTVLQVVRGKDEGAQAIDWWREWNLHNELNTSDILPTYETIDQFDRTREVQLYQPLESGDLVFGETHSCFVAGTPVWTREGQVPIEEIKIGTLVLSQDPHTGELSYRPVIHTTVGPPSPTVELVIGEDTIVATRGHRFWISGKGWEMAKFLKPGTHLVAIGGSSELRSAMQGEEVEAYNLEVGEFHTYFVGESRILVHDIGCPQPTNNVLPGVSPRAEFAPQLALKN